MASNSYFSVKWQRASNYYGFPGFSSIELSLTQAFFFGAKSKQSVPIFGKLSSKKWAKNYFPYKKLNMQNKKVAYFALLFQNESSNP